MSAAISLLLTALQLLTVVANTPNLPQSVKDQAITIGNQAISEAQIAILTNNQNTQTPIILTPQQTQPIQLQTQQIQQEPILYGATLKPTNTLSLYAFCLQDECRIHVKYADQTGNPIEGPLTITASDQGEFINYSNPQFVSASKATITTGSRDILYHPSESKPIFTVTDGKLTSQYTSE